MRSILSLFAALALTACATLPAAAPVRSDGLARSGKSTRVGALRRHARCAVVEDSRCPINARCVWAGRLVVRTEIDGAAGAETRNLTLGEPHRDARRRR